MSSSPHSQTAPTAAGVNIPPARTAAVSFDINGTLQRAAASYSAGASQQAEQLCRQILAVSADHPDTLQLLGIITAQTGRAAEAAQLLQRVVAAAPDNAEAHFNYASILHALGSVDRALESYTRALAIQPAFPEAYNNQGNALNELRRFDEALDSYQRALSLRPDFPEALTNRALALRGLGRLEEALRSCERSLEVEPHAVFGHLTRGVILQDLGRGDAALSSYDRALALQPDCAEAHKNRGDVFRERGEAAQALQSYERALRLAPRFAEACHGSSNILRDLRRLDEALERCAHALQLKPQLPEAHNTRGVILQDLGRFEEALNSFQAALTLNPRYADAYRNRGGVLQELGRHAEAAESYERALQIAPEYPWLLGTRLFARLQICDWRDFPTRSAELASRIKDNRKAVQPFAALALFDSPALHRAVVERWVSERCPPGPAVAAAPQRGHDRVIRLGYFSADYHDHATSYLAAGLFEMHDRTRFRLVAFSFGPEVRGGMRTRVTEGFDEFIDVRGLADEEVVRLSRDKQIDIAIDLKGFTQNSRAGIFAQRAAPVQVSYLAYPGTMGAPYMDYLVADRVLIPGDSRAHYSEKIVYLPNSYQVNDRKRQIAEEHFARAELALPEQGVVFCCFNNSFKITPEVFDSWMRILAAVPGSVLWLLRDNETAARNLRREASARGIEDTRLVFAPRIALPEHLARQRAADLCLDTIPYNSHTTASDALWAGVPILTRAGESFAARVSASLLRAMGLDELITTAAQEYEAKAIALAKDRARLAMVRARVQNQRLESPLFDTRLFTAHLEAAYAEIHRRHLAGSPPQDIDVAALIPGPSA